MTQLLNGNRLAIEIRKEISKEIDKNIRNKKKRIPHLGIILLGNNSSSLTYVNSKIKECKNLGIQSTLVHLTVEISELELLKEIQKMNENSLIDGFIIQLPIPKHINTDNIILAINPKKDIDGFHPENFGKMSLNMNTFLPATALGILVLLEKYKIKISGKNTVVIGRSRIVGRPISILMSRKNYLGNSTVTLTHSYTKNIENYTKNADIIIISVGIPGFLTGKMIKKGAIIIDVGINKVKNKKKFILKGDVDFNSVYGKASYLTPVPGGVGPMTRIMLIKNILIAAALNNKKK
ncbi:bifunctional 5,10-methylenetetrahydrofolate dehydrogenase/5,10-methenyltetrahydrofolate cyclohydrolase [Blattabacterium punctulatus]|uniref:bifunctional 5,10-methylenetetrahydrofolate dehydrogenase/5,10-methenyltetrahydrofolate cyclohydrolase n=1 Tax=Blattabacterium punctulatus TaxID=164514 RepID=UPI000D7C6EAD|nr:bifunctional 5,10-methylenetetrahydrofolate dehydrogenase/5,10-methenyltetrahydrofolate cyclohydrolase [Blattabacterium punctulatus]AWU44392.1 bifunctional 5,10-methylene-tetrahydrofolate dehydrogenase/5,10-methylene-tetrahydrofolate cyclohydrolase [Blattabacterium punctulatus]AWU45476.1 bifunctional 5,10-methylene-tetrahydrofolate dehydrogenase/5,10-methylene-tetrahydrofolate cyclohydrolase [Blattabacterium punctulatus]